MTNVTPTNDPDAPTAPDPTHGPEEAQMLEDNLSTDPANAETLAHFEAPASAEQDAMIEGFLDTPGDTNPGAPVAVAAVQDAADATDRAANPS